MTLEVVQAYYDAVASDLQVRIAEIAQEQSDTTLRQTEQRRAAGTQPEFDLLRARVARDNSRTIVIARRVDRDVVVHGAPPPARHSAERADHAHDVDRRHGPRRFADAGGACWRLPPDTVVANRIVVRQAAEAVDGQEGLWKASKSQVWPQLQLTSQYGRVGYPANVDPFAPTYFTNWNFGFGLSFPIVTGGRIKGDKVVAEAGVREAKSGCSR